MFEDMGKRSDRSNPINFRNWAVISVISLGCTFYVGDAMVVTSKFTQTESQAFEHEALVDDAIKVNLNCSFEKEGPIYICRLRNLNLTANVEVVSVSGSHLPGKTNADVKGIHFKSGTMFFLPMGIGKFFKNLIAMVAGDGYEKPISFKNVKRSSFQNLSQLTLLSIFTDVIADVDCDAFSDLHNLRDFLISGNGSINLHEKTFQQNGDLREVVFLSAQLNCIPAKLFRNNLLLEAVYLQRCSIKSINESLFETNSKLVVVSLSSNEIEHLPKNLFKNNLLLQIVDFADNALKTIDIDFTKLTNIDFIELDDNVCIDAFYEADGHRYDDSFTNLTEFQSVIRANCSCHSDPYKFDMSSKINQLV